MFGAIRSCHQAVLFGGVWAKLCSAGLGVAVLRLLRDDVGMGSSRHVSHSFGPFMVSNRRWGKIVPPYFAAGLTWWPIDDIELTVEVEDQRSRITATRVVAGGVLLGPAGIILGGLARKDVTKGRMILVVAGVQKQVYEFPGRNVDKAVAFIAAVEAAQTNSS